MANKFGVLLIARVALGLVAAVLVPASFSLIADFFPPERRAGATSGFVIGQAAGQAFGVFAGGQIFDWLSHGVRLAILAGFSPWRLIYCGAALMGAPLALVLVRLNEPVRQEKLHTARDTAAAFRELSSYKGFLIPLIGGALCIQLTMQASSVWTPTVLIRNFHLMPGQFGVWLSIVLLVGGLAGAYAAGRLGEWSRVKFRGEQVLLPAVGASLTIAPLSCFGLATSIPPFAIMLGAGVTAGAIVATLNIIAITLVIPNEIRGLALGINAFACTVFGTAVAPLAVAWLSEKLGGAMHLGAAISLLCTPSSFLASLLFLTAARSRVPARSLISST